MNLLSKSFMLMIEETITIGELKLTLLAQVMGTKKAYDIEHCDTYNISYMGMDINGYQNWRKFKDFHKEMGIDFDAHINKKFDEIFTQDAVREFVNKLEF